MGGINVQRWILGGLAAGIVIWLLEGALGFLTMDQATTAMEARGMAVEMNASMMFMGALLSVLIGVTAVFFYAAARPRFGPGPKTAALVALVLWFAGYVPNLMGYGMMGLFPAGLLSIWGVQGLAELVVATIVGAWIYREGEPAEG